MTTATPAVPTAGQTVVNTLETLAPVLLGLMASSNPSIGALLPIALQMVEAAAGFQQAGAWTQAQFDAAVQQAANGVLTAHNAWVAAAPKA
jgi:hypothetical protein